jgi:hypothetical protein
VPFADHAFQVALGAAYRQALDVGEALATAGRIIDGDAASWLREWTANAEAVRAVADRGAASGAARERVRRLPAGRHLTTSTAVQRILGTSERERHGAIRRRVIARSAPSTCSRSPASGQRSLRGHRLPAYFFRTCDCAAGRTAPLVVINDGGDGATSQAWVQGGAAAGERGYHRVAFDVRASRPPCSSGDAVPPRLRGDAYPVFDAMPWVGSCAEAPDELSPVAGSTRSRGGRRRNRRRYHMSFRRRNGPSSWWSEVDDGCAHGLPLSRESRRQRVDAGSRSAWPRHKAPHGRASAVG